MAKQPLVRRQIRTAKGATVYRMVREDNPNIITAPQPAQAPRAARQRAQAVPKPKPVTKAPPVVKMKTQYKVESFAGCCGGRLVYSQEVPAGTRVDTRTDAEIEADWKKTLMYTSYYREYERIVKQGHEALEAFAAGKKPSATNRYYYYTKSELPYLKEDITMYEGYLKRYGLATYKAQGDITKTSAVWEDGVPPVRGVMAGVVEFPGSHQTPAGLWVRCDYAWGTLGDSTPTPAFKKARMQIPDVTEQPLNLAEIVSRGDPSGSRPTSYASPVDYLKVLYLSGAVPSTTKLWQYIRDAKYRSGDIVTFILNKGQATETSVQALADAGFRCVLITGNTNHPTSSILYMYERKITHVDIEQLHPKTVAAKEPLDGQ